MSKAQEQEDFKEIRWSSLPTFDDYTESHDAAVDMYHDIVAKGQVIHLILPEGAMPRLALPWVQLSNKVTNE